MTITEPKALLPLTSPVLHILLSLVDGKKHGYAIMKEVEEISEGNVNMGPGTLYGSIKRMIAAGLIKESDTRPDPILDDTRRRYYEITAFGTQVIEHEFSRLRRLVLHAENKNLGG